MANIFAHLNIGDTDRVFAQTPGQRVVWDAVQEYVAKYNAAMNAAMSVFIEGTTEDFKRRYKMPGGGTLPRRGPNVKPAATRPIGSWDIALPLEDFGDAFIGNDIAMAYMTAEELTATISSILIRNTNTVRFEILKAILNNTARTFVDDLHGSLSVVPLANGDSTVYPPVEGSETEATEDHYLESGYTAASISDSNNPFPTIVAELEQHFGAPTGNSNVVVFHNNAETAKVSALAAFEEVPDRFILPGDDTAVPRGLPNVPGKILGRVSGAWAVEYRWIPASYMIGIHLDQPKPLLMRVDPADTGLGAGLVIIGTEDETPFEGSYYRNRFGLGGGNRLNGVVMELGTGGTYTIPTAYA